MKSSYNSRPVPADGKPIEYVNGQFIVPDRPIIPYIEGDGTGRDIWKASRARIRRGRRKSVRRQTQSGVVRNFSRREIV